MTCKKVFSITKSIKQHLECHLLKLVVDEIYK